MKKKIYLFIGSFLIFLGTLELGTRLFDLTPRNYYYRSDIFEFADIREPNDLARLSSAPDRSGAIARSLLPLNFSVKPEKRNSEYPELLKEAPYYAESAQGRPYMYGAFNVHKGLNDDFTVYGLHSRKVKYRAHYSSDEFGRRITNSNSSNESFVFLGDSITFGQGVDDSDSFPFQFAALTKQNVVNLGVPGASPTAILRSLRKREIKFTAPIAGDSITVVYTFIPEHIMRTIGTMRFFRDNSDSYINYPFAKLDNDNLVIAGNFKDDPRVWGKSLNKLLSNSKFLGFLDIDFPPLDESDMHLLVRVFQEIRNEFMKLHPKTKRFYFANFPFDHNRNETRWLMRELSKNQIDVLDYTSFMAQQFLGDQFHLEYDYHPSGLSYSIYSQLLSMDLMGKK